MMGLGDPSLRSAILGSPVHTPNCSLNRAEKERAGQWPRLTSDLAQVICLRQDRGRHTGLPRRIDVLQEALRHADRLSCAESWSPGPYGEQVLVS